MRVEQSSFVFSAVAAHDVVLSVIYTSITLYLALRSFA
jgi:hypothetical protein